MESLCSRLPENNPDLVEVEDREEEEEITSFQPHQAV
jgi:hypothetical protein